MTEPNVAVDGVPSSDTGVSRDDLVKGLPEDVSFGIPKGIPKTLQFGGASAVRAALFDDDAELVVRYKAVLGAIHYSLHDDETLKALAKVATSGACACDELFSVPLQTVAVYALGVLVPKRKNFRIADEMASVRVVVLNLTSGGFDRATEVKRLRVVALWAKTKIFPESQIPTNGKGRKIKPAKKAKKRSDS